MLKRRDKMEVTKKEITYLSKNKKTTIHAVAYYPEDGVNIKGIVQISHGMCEYIGRYDRFARYLSSQGFLVCGNNHMGHGDSVESEAELGFFSDENGYKYLVEDVHTLTQKMKEKYPNLPYFLLGHSMGSFIVRCYIAKYGKELTGAIICGTCGPMKVINPAIKAAEMVESRKGKMYRSKFINDLAFGTFNLKFQPIKTRYDWVSSDEEIVAKYNQDTRCNFIFTARAFHDLFHLIRGCNLSSCFAHTPDDLPLFVISGSMDPVGEYSEGVLKVYKLYIEHNASDATLKLYPGMRHEILNEVKYEQVYQDILNWIQERI